MYGYAVVSQILFVQRLDVLFGDDGDDDFSADLVKDPLVEVVRPQPALFLLKSEEVAACFGIYCWIDEVGFRDRHAIQGDVCGEQPHFSSDKPIRRNPCAPPPTDCRGRR